MIDALKKIVRQLLPYSIRRHMHIMSLPTTLKEDFYIGTIQKRQKKALLNLKGKEVIKCCFFALNEEVWKYDDVIKIMQTDSRFSPIVLVCPVVNYGYENMIERMNQCFDYFKKKGYETILSYDSQENTYIDVRKAISPDIIFYTNPYEGLIDNRYYIDKFRDILTIYVPYSINNSNAWISNYDLLFENLLWRHYLPTDKHKSYAIKYGRNKGVNAVTVGYSGIEELINPNHKIGPNVWKSDNQKLKRIIWAPHHTIQSVGKGSLYYSCFLRYCETMLVLALKYKDSIQIAFKPHPLLKNKLELLWGKSKTDDYYQKWETQENTCVKEGDYIDLFLTSDAMIHDSGSFISEYLYVNKPVMRTLNEIDESVKMNDFAMECLANHYLAHNEVEIEQFIQDVINNNDPLKGQRTKFVKEVLLPQGSPSQNIIDDILDSIENQILYRD